jgi:hypothetical protein
VHRAERLQLCRATVDFREGVEQRAAEDADRQIVRRRRRGVLAPGYTVRCEVELEISPSGRIPMIDGADRCA